MIAAAWLALALPAAAQSASLEFKPPAQAVLGTPVEIEGAAALPSGSELGFEPYEAAASSGAVTVLGVEIGEPSADGGAVRRRVKLTVAAFELGMVTVPDLRWRATTGGGPGVPIAVPPIRFESVGPPGVKADQEIRDIRGPLSPAWWPFALLAALLAAAGLWWRLSRPEAEGGTAAEPVDTRLPHERALAELHALFQSEVPVKEFYIRLTDILRRYLQARFGVDASVLTTGDLIKQLRESELDRPLLSRCREVFDHADLVKFARWVPATPEIRKDWSEAESLVQQTAPKPPPVPETAPIKE